MSQQVNNEIYNEYGERWYTADNDPVALLREEGHFKNLWIRDSLKIKYPNKKLKILDIGCGGGFLSNMLALEGHEVIGIDISESSLKVAEKYDGTKSVSYIKMDVSELSNLNEKFDVICAMDLLEHIEQPELLIKNISKCLTSNGIFFFHTFNRNPISYLVIIKLVEWLVPNTPKNLHVLSYFIKPHELKKMLEENYFQIKFIKGIRPVLLNTNLYKSIFLRKVLPGIYFTWTKSLITSYAGYAQNIKEPI